MHPPSENVSQQSLEFKFHNLKEKCPSSDDPEMRCIWVVNCLVERINLLRLPFSGPENFFRRSVQDSKSINPIPFSRFHDELGRADLECRKP